MNMTEVRWAVQQCERTLGAEWVTTAPIRTATVLIEDMDEAARRIEAGHFTFMSSVRGRIAVWSDPDVDIPLGPGGPHPDGVYEVTTADGASKESETDDENSDVARAVRWAMQQDSEMNAIALDAASRVADAPTDTPKGN